MTQPREQAPREDRLGKQELETAYGGFSLHTHAVASLLRRETLTSNEKDSLRDAGSNAINSPYVWRWQDMTSTVYGTVPSITSPSSDLHLRLFSETRAEYDRLQNKQLRIFLAGEEGLQVPNPQLPIATEESGKYLVAAQAQGVIKGFSAETPQLELDSDVFNLYMTLRRNGITLNKASVDGYRDILFADGFRSDLQVAALHKLGTHVALIEQMAYESQAQGEPIWKEYLPTPNASNPQVWERDTSFFEGGSPTLQEFYEMAQDTLKRHRPNDPLTRHLLSLPSSLV